MYHARSRSQVVLIRGKIVRSATVNIGNKIYDRPIQRIYELEGCDRTDRGQFTNELLHLIDFDTSSQTTDLLRLQKPLLKRLKYW